MLFRQSPLFSRFLIFVIIPLFLILIFLWHQLQSSLSPTSGVLTVNGLNNPVTIEHDDFGTPFIKAKSDSDAYFALGFKHASDRLWQMELQRRLAQGRLSEIFGTSSVTTDVWLRTLGLNLAAKNAWNSLSPKAQHVLEAYRDGVNSFMTEAVSLPPEFQILQIQPEPWTVFDSLSWQKVFALNLNRNLFDEINRFVMKNRFSSAQMQTFFPYDPLIKSDTNLTESMAVTANFSPTFHAQQESLQSQWGIGHRFAGSNAWVVSGKYTQSGKPILANDPHLGLQIPSLWYSVSLKGDQLDVSGMSLVGLPVVIFGQNQHISWGGTSLESDQQDLFIETVSNDDPNLYLTDSGWRTFQTRKEVIQVKADMPASLRPSLNPVEISVRSTEIGPVISDIHSASDKILTLRWAALDQDDRTFEAFVNLQYATDWESFQAALQLLKAPGMDFLYADQQGNIGAQAAGMMPKRGTGVGILPQSAYPTSNQWQGYVDFAYMPSAYNPEQGYWVSANERKEHSEQIVISHEWAPPARKQRIESLLKTNIDNNTPMDVATMQAIQRDQLDVSIQPLLSLLTRLEPNSIQSDSAITTLKNWNGEFTPDEAAASIFYTWVEHLRQAIFSNELKHTWQRQDQANLIESMAERVTHDQLAKVLKADALNWCTPTESIFPCQSELRTSLEKSLKQLEKLTNSNDIADWRWGDIHRTEFGHQPFSRVRGLKSFFTRTTRVGGSPNSVNAANAQLDWSRGYIQNFGAGFRQVFELDENRSQWYMNSTGQSGHVMSPHYDDMVELFSQGQLTPMLPSSTSTQTLVPSHLERDL